MTYPIRLLCKMMDVNPVGYYGWLKEPLSPRGKEDKRQTGLIKQLWLESGCVYGYRKLHMDMREIGEPCGKHRVLRLMKAAQIKAEIGYKKRKGVYGKPAVAAPNLLEQNFDTHAPDRVWVTDITYIRTYEGFLYLAVIIDLFSRKVIGWSMQSTLAADIIMNAILMAVWRRKPTHEVIIHSDQGSQFQSDDWKNFLKNNHLVPSMSRRGNCYDNAAAETFFQLLKRERIRRKIYATREEARNDVFNYIELFYNPIRRHGYTNNLSPVEYEQAYFMKLGSV
jgi:putative transposase